MPTRNTEDGTRNQGQRSGRIARLVARSGTQFGARGWFVVWLALATVLAGGLRLHKLGAWSLWEDELYSVRSVLESETAMVSKQLGYAPIWAGLLASGVDLGAHAITPEMQAEALEMGGARALIEPDTSAWRAAGIDEWSVRIGPAVVGTLLVPVVAWASVGLLTMRGAAILAFLLATSPWMVFWSQAGRFYMPQALCAGLAVAWFWRAEAAGTRGSGWRWFAASMAALVGVFLMQPPGLLLGAGLGLFAFGAVVLRRRAPGGDEWGGLGWAHVGVGAAVMLGCVALYVWDTRQLAEGAAYHHSIAGHGPAQLLAGWVLTTPAELFAFAGLAFLGLLGTAARGRAALLALCAWVPVLGVAALSVKGETVYVRYVFLTLVPLLMLVALGLDALVGAGQAALGRVREEAGPAAAAAGYGAVGWAAVGVVLAVQAMALVSYYGEGHGFRRRWKPAFEHVQTLAGPGKVASERTMIAEYYLGTTDVQAWPRDAEELENLAASGPIWLVVPMASARETNRFPYVEDRGELLRYFDVRILQPYSSVRVYCVEPQGDPR